MHTEIFVKSFGLLILGFVKVNNFPPLLWGLIRIFSVVDANVLAFFISSTINVKYLIVVNVGEV